jgi:hypothetical protein
MEYISHQSCSASEPHPQCLAEVPHSDCHSNKSTPADDVTVSVPLFCTIPSIQQLSFTRVGAVVTSTLTTTDPIPAPITLKLTATGVILTFNKLTSTPLKYDQTQVEINDGGLWGDYRLSSPQQQGVVSELLATWKGYGGGPNYLNILSDGSYNSIGTPYTTPSPGVGVTVVRQDDQVHFSDPSLSPVSYNPRGYAQCPCDEKIYHFKPSLLFRYRVTLTVPCSSPTDTTIYYSPRYYVAFVPYSYGSDKVYLSYLKRDETGSTTEVAAAKDTDFVPDDSTLPLSNSNSSTSKHSYHVILEGGRWSHSALIPSSTSDDPFQQPHVNVRPSFNVSSPSTLVLKTDASNKLIFESSGTVTLPLSGMQKVVTLTLKAGASMIDTSVPPVSHAIPLTSVTVILQSDGSYEGEYIGSLTSYFNSTSLISWHGVPTGLLTSNSTINPAYLATGAAKISFTFDASLTATASAKLYINTGNDLNLNDIHGTDDTSDDVTVTSHPIDLKATICIESPTECVTHYLLNFRSHHVSPTDQHLTVTSKASTIPPFGLMALPHQTGTAPVSGVKPSPCKPDGDHTFQAVAVDGDGSQPQTLPVNLDIVQSANILGGCSHTLVSRLKPSNHKHHKITGGIVPQVLTQQHIANLSRVDLQRVGGVEIAGDSSGNVTDYGDIHGPETTLGFKHPLSTTATEQGAGIINQSHRLSTHQETNTLIYRSSNLLPKH